MQAQRPARLVHVFVALADNAHQGIVPVPAALGNGDDAAQNLYWGAAAFCDGVVKGDRYQFSGMSKPKA